MAYEFTGDGVPVTQTGAQQTSALLKTMPVPRFRLMHHPDGWEVVADGKGGYELLPRLKRLEERPGVHGVRAGRGRNGVPDTGLHEVRFRDRGWTIFPQVIEPPKGRRGEPIAYCVAHQGVRGLVHHLAWDIPRQRRGGRTEWAHDAQGYNDFRRQLVKWNMVEPPDLDCLERMIRLQRKRVHRRSKFEHLPHGPEALAREQARLSFLTQIASKAEAAA